MAYENIPDGQVAAYAPITARLKRRLRDNFAAKEITLIPDGLNGGDSGPTGTFASVATLPIWVPDCLVGSSGAKLRLYIQCSSISTGAATAEFRITDGATVSNVETITHVGASSLEDHFQFDLTWTPSGNSYVDIDFEGREASGTLDSLAMLWENVSVGSTLVNALMQA